MLIRWYLLNRTMQFDSILKLFHSCIILIISKLKQRPIQNPFGFLRLQSSPAHAAQPGAHRAGPAHCEHWLTSQEIFLPYNSPADQERKKNNVTFRDIVPSKYICPTAIQAPRLQPPGPIPARNTARNVAVIHNGQTSEAMAVVLISIDSVLSIHLAVKRNLT